MTFSATPPPDDQLTLLVWFIVRFKPDPSSKDEYLRGGTIYPVPGSQLGAYMSKPGWDWMRRDEFWKADAQPTTTTPNHCDARDREACAATFLQAARQGIEIVGLKGKIAAAQEALK